MFESSTDKGYTVVNQCPIRRYFTQGVEVIDESTLMISQGWHDHSKLVILKYDFDGCTFEESFSKDIA